MRDHVVLAGGSGFLGSSLVEHFKKQDIATIVLTRNPSHDYDVSWDGVSVGDWTASLNHAKAVINLSGRSVDCRYTAANRREIIESRINPVRAIGQALTLCSHPPKVWIQASSLAIYGDAGERICDENAPHGDGFSVEVCKTWEKEFFNQSTPDTRKVALRIGFVLAAHDGALKRFASLTQWFLGGTVSHGKQYISWLHIVDLNNLVQWCIEHEEIEGIFNATAPHPVTNAIFLRTLRKVLHRPWSPPTPAFAVRIGAYLMGTEASLALTGRRCIPDRLMQSGFTFQFPQLDSALQDIY